MAEDKQASVLLTLIGPKVYAVVAGLLAPIAPKNKTYQQLADVLGAHYDPKELVTAERFRFYRHTQKPTESMTEFMAALRKLSSTCDFGGFLEQAALCVDYGMRQHKNFFSLKLPSLP